MHAMPVPRSILAAVFLIGASCVSACNAPSLRALPEPTHETVTGAGSSGYGHVRVEYDHTFQVDARQGSEGFQMTLAIQGWVPLELKLSGVGPHECLGQVSDNLYHQLAGSGTVSVRGTLETFSRDGGCTCSLADSVDVQANAKTMWLRPPGERCDDEVVYVQLVETWYTHPDWKCQCVNDDDPALELVAHIPTLRNPNLALMTLEFPVSCPGAYLEEPFSDPTAIARGMYRWTWRPATEEPADPGRRFATQGALSLDEEVQPEGAPECTAARKAVWGPALDSIVQPASEWTPPP